MRMVVEVRLTGEGVKFRVFMRVSERLYCRYPLAQWGFIYPTAHLIGYTAARHHLRFLASYLRFKAHLIIVGAVGAWELKSQGTVCIITLHYLSAMRAPSEA